MASELQAEASRINGSKSQGPVTPEGQERSSRSNLVHGLCAKKNILIAGESEEEYNQHCDKIHGSFSWADGYEETQVDIYCNTTWQMKRCERLEAVALENGDFKAVDLFSHHKARLARIATSAINEVRKTISERETIERKELAQATIIRRLDLLKGVPTDMKTLGFDIPIERVDGEVYFLDRLAAGLKVAPSLKRR